MSDELPEPPEHLDLSPAAIENQRQAALDWAAQRMADMDARAAVAAASTAEAEADDNATIITPSELLAVQQDNPKFNKAVREQAAALAVREKATEIVRAAANPRKPLRVVSQAEVKRRPAPQWWVPDLLQKGTVAVFAGEAGIGKSFTLIDWTQCIATGVPWMGQPTGRGTVLYVAAEGASAFGKRLRAWEKANNISAAEGMVSYLEEGVNLMDPESVAELEAVLDDLQPDVIVLDTLSQLAAIDSENDAAQLAKVFRVAKQLRDHKEDSTVILAHHVNKGAGGVRGSSVIRSNADTVIVAKSKDGGFYLSTEIAQDGKQKDGVPVRIEGLKLTDAHGSAVVTRDAKAETDPDLLAVRDLFSDGLPHTKAEARLNAGIEKATNEDKEYVRWARKWKKWTKEGEAIILPVDGTDQFIYLDLAK